MMTTSISTLVRKNIRDLRPYSSARDEFSGQDGIFLDANENPFGILNRYPDPWQKKLKSSLAVLKNMDKENIFIGNGSDEIIDLTFRIFCEPGKDKVLTFSPTYGMYDVAANINNIELIKVPLNEEFQINLDATTPYLADESIKIIFICSPNNPTGNTIRIADIEWLLTNFNGVVFIDEAYIDFSNQPSWIERLQLSPNIIISQTFSKAWGLAAARVGVAYANKEMLFYFNKVKPPYNVSALNQQAAIQALEENDRFKKNRLIILKEKEILIQGLKNISCVQKIYPSDANFLLIEVTDANRIYQQLVEQKIIVRNRSQLVENCIRISIGKATENQQLLNALQKIN